MLSCVSLFPSLDLSPRWLSASSVAKRPRLVRWKTRIGARIQKTYDEPKTPYRRVEERSPHRAITVESSEVSAPSSLRDVFPASAIVENRNKPRILEARMFSPRSFAKPTLPTPLYSFNSLTCLNLRFSLLSSRDHRMKIILLTLSNVFMTFAWYGHLRNQS